MRQIIAIGGGSMGSKDDGLLIEKYILEQTGQSQPRICFLAQASAESPGYVVRFYDTFLSLGAVPSSLSLFGSVQDGWEQRLLDQHVIYVGGGNTRSMLALWREWGVDRVLRQALDRGVILAGVSAGAICWFEQGVTDSRGKLGALECLGFLGGSCCPHYDSEPDRRPTFASLLADGNVKGGLSLEDGAAAHFVNGKLRRVVTSRPNAHAYWVRHAAGTVTEEQLPVEYLGGNA